MIEKLYRPWMLPPSSRVIARERLPPAVAHSIGTPDFYHKLAFLDLVAEPVVLGITPIELPVDLVLSSGKCVFRFISLFGKPLPWPPSFEICFRGRWVKKTPNDRSLFHFLPPCVKTGQAITIRADCESPKCVFVVQLAEVRPALLFQLPSTTVGAGAPLSPLSARKMLFPARSSACAHAQCVELEELLAYIERSGRCPLCGARVEASTLSVQAVLQQEALTEELAKSRAPEEFPLFEFDLD
jgi:hypothetical protein